MDGGLQIGVACAGFGERCGDRDVVILLVERSSREIGRRFGEFDLQQHVGLLVLHRLEGADHTAELHAHHRVGKGVFTQARRTTDHLVGQADCRFDHGSFKGRGTLAFLAEQLGLGIAEGEVRKLAGRVERSERTARQP